MDLSSAESVPGASENVHASGALHYLKEVIVAQATARGFSDGFLAIALVFLLAVIPAWNLGKTRKGAKTAQRAAPAR